jgi:hypothetical protein
MSGLRAIDRNSGRYLYEIKGDQAGSEKNGRRLERRKRWRRLRTVMLNAVLIVGLLLVMGQPSKSLAGLSIVIAAFSTILIAGSIASILIASYAGVSNNEYQCPRCRAPASSDRFSVFPEEPEAAVGQSTLNVIIGLLNWRWCLAHAAVFIYFLSVNQPWHYFCWMTACLLSLYSIPLAIKRYCSSCGG